jgi:23S rRNA-intervening sequence protein
VRFITTELSHCIQHSALGIQPVKGDAEMKDFRDLQVWHKAHSLTLATYRVTSEFLKQEMYGLTSQLRRLDSRQYR